MLLSPGDRTQSARSSTLGLGRPKCSWERFMTKREFLAAGLGAGLALSCGSAAFAQGGRKLPVRKAKTTKLFKSPQGFPNAIAVAPEGLWIGEQKLSGEQAKAYK